jgi:hypothetical protein
VYLLAILVSTVGVLVLAGRRGLGLRGRRVLLALVVTLPVFLAIDVAGSVRGWFRSDPALSLAILPGGVSLEEPFLLAFLVLVAITLWRGAARLLGG